MAHIYFFKDSRYALYDTEADKVIKSGSIRDNYPGLHHEGFDHDLDAAVEYGNGYLYLFKGEEYIQYDLGNRKVIHKSKIAKYWNGMEEIDFDSNIDASC